jgi:hypothetical protein
VSEVKTTVEVSDEVVDRLRKSQKEYDESVFAAGKKAGEEWAKNGASAAELRRLESFPGISASGFWGDVSNDGDELLAAGEYEFRRGFSEGALEVWEAVKDKL